MPRFTDPAYFSKHPWLEYVFIFCVCCGQLLTQEATTDAMTHMYTLQKDFHDPASMMPWYSASFGLSVGTLILVSGRLGDVFGIKEMLVGGYVWTVIWSLLCGISYYDRQNGSKLYICCRTFQGCGIAFVLPNVLAAAGRVYAPNTLRKRLVFGAVGLCAPMGGFFGVWWSGIIGVRTDRWDWNYYAYAMFAAVIGIITWISVPNLKVHRLPDGSRQSVDWIGAFCAITAMTLFNFVWNEAPVVGWQKAYIIVLLCVSVPMFGVFALWEVKFADNPLLPKEVLASPRLMGVLVLEFFGWGTFGINCYHTLQLYQQFRHYSPFAAGSTMAVCVPMGAAAALTCSVMISHKTVELILLCAMLFFLTTSIILATTPVHQTYWRQTFGAWIVGPFGMDWSFPAGSIMLSEELPPHWQGLAGSLITVTMNYGISIFLGVAGTVEGQLLKQRPDDEWRAWRGAEYFAVGLSGLACCIALMFVLNKFLFNKRPNSNDVESEVGESRESPEGECEKLDDEGVTVQHKNPNLSSDSVSNVSVVNSAVPVPGPSASAS